MADRPTERLDNLVDRACRVKLTEAEGAALRRAVAELQQSADTSEEQRRIYREAWLSAKRRARKATARAERAEQQHAQYAALLAEYVQLADITHKYSARHDCLGANHGCAGCDLRDRAHAALDGAQQPETADDGLPCRHGCRAAADELAQQTQQNGHTGGR